MKRIDVVGLGVHIEIFKRKEELTDLEMIREAIKALQREVLKRESHINSNTPRQLDNH